jgi:hypothetical protein
MESESESASTASRNATNAFTEPTQNEKLLQQLLFDYRRLDSAAIEKELQEIELVRKEIDESWQAESTKYEETVTRTVEGIDQTVPRRNYFNPEGVVQDTSLFPYHDMFYPLIDAYDCLYAEGEQQPIEPNSTRPFSVPVELRTLEERGRDERLKASPLAVMACVLECSLSELVLGDNSIDDGQSTMWETLSSIFHIGQSRDEVKLNFEHSRLPLPPRQRSLMLLKLFRHAMSDLQRDYYLAVSIMTRLCRNDDMDDRDVLRRVLAVIDAEFVECQNPCPDSVGDNHICAEWIWMMDVLHMAISRGLMFVAEVHAVTLVAYVKAVYLHEFGGTESGHAPQREDRNESRKVPIQLVLTIIRAIGSRAWLEKRRLLAALKRQDFPEIRLRIYLDNYWNCIRSLVEIGELTLEIVPIKSENFDEIGSEIVKNLACAFIQQAIIPDRRSHASNEYLKPPSLPSIICPGRYLNCVADATERWERREESRRVMALGGKDAIACVLDVSRPDDVREVIRALFVRNFVDVRQSGLGYGDFLTWCGYDVNPLDPVLFW